MEDITYKYIPIERISYLKDELLRITQPGDLNDPFECRPVKLSIEEIHSLFNAFTTQQIEAINKMKISKDRRSELKNLLVRKFKSEKTKILKNESGNFRDKFDSDAYAKLNSKIGILSLSKRWDSILMWAHYTDAHKGLCIGFDSNEPFFKNFKSIASESKIFLPVIYADERTRIPIEQGKSIDSKVMLTKAKYWEYEQEERLLVSFNEASKKINAKPFDIYLYKVPHGLIREIIAGANISKEFLDEVTKFCNEKTIKLFRSAISETEFSMIRDLV